SIFPGFMRLVRCSCSGQPPRSQGRNTDRHQYDCGDACLHSHGFLSGSRRSESRLQGYFLQVAIRKAAAEAVKTEAFSGAFTPRARVIARANKSSSQPLKKAATRVNAPRTSATPSRIVTSGRMRRN